jgi:hypothetical protein
VTTNETRAVTVFISYSHDSTAHAGRVLALAERLKQDGVTVLLDQYEQAPSEGWPRWMDKHIRDADFVLLVCTATYCRRVTREEEPGVGQGVKWEGNLIYNAIYTADADTARFIPVLLAGGKQEHIPMPLRGATFYRLGTDQGYDNLYRRLTGQLEVGKPLAGKRSSPIRKPRKPVVGGATPALNPFFRDCVKDPGCFFGRTQLVREVRQMLLAGNSVSLVGEPEIGKSALLRYLDHTRAEWLPAAALCYLDLQGVLDEADFCAEALKKLEAASGDLRDLRRALRRGRTVLLLDEVEKLSDPSFSTRLHEVLRALAQEKTLTLAVASYRPLDAVFPPGSPTSPFHNIFTVKRVEPFSSEESRAYLAERLAGTGVNWTPEEIAALLNESGGCPGRLQRAAARLYERDLTGFDEH